MVDTPLIVGEEPQLIASHQDDEHARRSDEDVDGHTGLGEHVPDPEPIRLSQPKGAREDLVLDRVNLDTNIEAAAALKPNNPPRLVVRHHYDHLCACHTLASG